MSDKEGVSESVLLSLPKTRLDVLQTKLHRRNADDSILFWLPLSAVLSAEFRRPIDSRSLVIIAAGAGLVAIGRFVSDYNLVTCLLYVSALFIVILPIFGIRKDQLVLRTAENTMYIDCDELSGDVRCFTIALNILLNSGRNDADKPA